METTKKASKRAKRNPKPIINPYEVISDAALEPQTQETTPQQEEPKPLFTSENEQAYRNLLLERPGVPFISNIGEAVAFVEAYGKWNRKVQLAFK